ncbi:zinc finger protein 423-like isoform X1 [Branchiostoma lanceolatum]|uniref:zinc finger protein 423-like isoform X1 n=1 Tax=Branchiostoma lanceolatum TaxID=7740 RepID=UPI003453D9CA
MALSPGQTVDGLESGIKLNFPEQHAQLAKCLNALRETGRYCDITVKVQDKSFSCHRAVLACRTPLFQCLGDDPIVRVDFLNPAAFSALLDYMYTSELTVSSTSYSDEDLLAAAQALRLRPVVEWLTDYLKAKGAVDQVLEHEGNLHNTVPSSLLMPSATVNLTSNTVSALFPRNPGLAFLNNAPYSPQTELQAASTSLGQNQPIESLFFKNMGKSNGVATVTTEDVSSPAPARWDPQLSTCYRCGVHFLSSKVLKQHLAVCGGGSGKEPSCMQNSIADPPRQRPVFGCSRCSQYFVSAKTLQMHLKVCSKLREYKCSLCQLRFVSQRALDFHTRDCWKSVQEFESPQGSRSTNIRGSNSNKKKPNEVGSFSRKGGNGEKNTARLQDTSKPQQQERSSDESVVEVENMEESGSQEVLMLNAKDIDISKLITSKQFCCSNCCDIFTTPHKLQIHKRKCIKSPGTSTADQQQKCVCDRCALSFPSMKSLQRHMQSCKKSFLFVDVRNKANKSIVSDKAAASSSREEQPVQEATVSEEATPSKQSAGTESPKPNKTSGTVSSVTSEKKTEDATAKPSEKDSKPVKESSGDDVEKSSKKDPSHTRRASSGGGSPALTMLRSSPRHMGRTLRSSPKKPHILSNLAKGNLRIKLIKKVHKTVTSQAAKSRRISAATSSSTTVSSAGKANTTPKVAGEKRAAEDRSPSAAKRLSTGQGTISTPSTAKEGPPNRFKTGKGSTTGHKNTAQVSGKQRQSSPAASTNTMPKPRPRVVLRRVDTAIGTPEGSNTISANIDTVIKLEPEDDSDQGEVSRSPQQPSGRNFGSPETSLFSAQYHCGNCGLSFGQRKAMQEHEFKCKQAFEEAYCQQLSKAAKSHCCQNCLKLFSSDSSLRAHREECQGNSVLYRCKICWEDTDQPKAHLEKHWRWNRPTELRNNPCLSIESDLPLIKSLYMSVVKPNEKWPCSLCENEKGSDRRRSVVMFKDRLRLWSHQASSHRVVWRNLTCPVCTGSFKFNQRIEYLRHMFANHVKLKKAEKTFHCQVCGKSFHDRGLLELHLFKHGRKTAK